MYAQWTMECMIGILESNLRLDSNPFANMQQIAICHVAMTGVMARMPELDESALDSPPEPNWCYNAGNVYCLLHPHDSHITAMTSGEAAAFSTYFSCSFDHIFVWCPT
jgi:hypothetical protein